MKKVLTAMANPELHEKLKEKKEIEIIGKDIQYQEGIFEIIEKENQIDSIFISENIIGNLGIIELIKKIKRINNKIHISIILNEEKAELEKELLELKNIKILYLNQMEEEKKIEKKNMKKIKLNKKRNFNNCNIISVLGSGGAGKSVFIYNLVSILQNKKILIIDLDIFNQGIQQLLKVKKNRLENHIIFPKENIENYIIKVNDKLDILMGFFFIINSQLELEKIINNLCKIYDVIFMDSNTKFFANKNKKIIQISNLAILLVEGNILEIKKTKNLLDFYLQKWNMKNKKIKIVINKYSEYSIDISIMKNIFKENQIIGKLNYYSEYAYLMEKNILSYIKIKQEYEKIKNKIPILKN